MSAPRAVNAGAAWSVDIEVVSGAAGESVDLLLFNGLTTLHQGVVTGTGGVARWSFAAGAVTQAGESVLIARYKGQESRQTVTVRPGRAEQADVLTTANGLRAYGDGRAMLIGLLRDALGNPPRAMTRANLHVRYPDGVEAETPLDLRAGLGWTWVESQGEPGRVRVDVTGDNTAAASIELQQLAGETEAVSLAIAPDCVSAGGRDVIRLVAQASDGNGFTVVDGTLITFTFRSGSGRGQTANGLASLNLPAPAEPGRYRYWAQVGDARSATAWLRVTEGLCR
ncbi:MAG: hypothetical protein IPK19_05095 [Chloroflexi bacterium]|nr:hypothetical protein [Chloroflexota bacterium]